MSLVTTVLVVVLATRGLALTVGASLAGLTVAILDGALLAPRQQ